MAELIRVSKDEFERAQAQSEMTIHEIDYCFFNPKLCNGYYTVDMRRFENVGSQEGVKSKAILFLRALNINQDAPKNLSVRGEELEQEIKKALDIKTHSIFTWNEEARIIKESFGFEATAVAKETKYPKFGGMAHAECELCFKTDWKRLAVKVMASVTRYFCSSCISSLVGAYEMETQKERDSRADEVLHPDS
jgi:hypothetical protein